MMFGMKSSDSISNLVSWAHYETTARVTVSIIIKIGILAIPAQRSCAAGRYQLHKYDVLLLPAMELLSMIDARRFAQPAQGRDKDAWEV